MAFPPHPEHHGAEPVFRLLRRLRLGWLLHHFSPLWIWSLYVFVNGFVTIALLALLALVTHTAFVFPSLGPTAYLLFFYPLAESSSPRNAILGHGIGLLCGYGALWVTGMHVGSPGAYDGVYGPRILAAALSMGATGALMVLARVSHPPAGATTLIVSLGILFKPYNLIIIEVAVCLLIAQALLINRLAGVPYPIWSGKKQNGSASF
jgi:CBS domain-containing membrane protein